MNAVTVVIPTFGSTPHLAACRAALDTQALRDFEGDNLPGGRFSPRKILHSIRRRGVLSFLKHAYGRIAQ